MKLKLKKLTEGRRMFLIVMAIFAVYAVIFILFEDFDRRRLNVFDEMSDWHLLIFSIVVMTGLGFLLYRYARRMDQRITTEQEQKNSQLRRELTQNIAHELKTPVASILGYSETLLENPDIAPDIAHKFIVRTHEQASRLTSLLQDISLLNKMDYSAQDLEMSRVNVSMLVADIISESEHSFDVRKMTVKNCMPQDVIVTGNTALLYSVFRNIIDNAINYAGDNTTIEITARKNSPFWDIDISDNGKGVPEELISRIFERFFTVDKGRSKSLGGTGLGLAIVKNAVLLHGGMVSAKNAPTGGLVISITLKI